MHTDRATPATFHSPGASQVSNSRLRALCCFHLGLGVHVYPVAHRSLCCRVHCFWLIFTVVHGVGMGAGAGMGQGSRAGQGRTAHRKETESRAGPRAGPPPPTPTPTGREAESALLVLPTPALRPLDFPGRGRQQGSRVLFQGRWAPFGVPVFLQ